MARISWNKGKTTGQVPWNKGRPMLPHVKDALVTASIGRTPWNKGIPMSAKSREKLSQSLQGHIPWNKGKQTGQAVWNKGLSWPQEVRDKISTTLTGRPTGRKGIPMPEWVGKRISEANRGRTPWNKGKKASPEAVEKMRAAKLGKPLGPMSDSQKAKIGAANKGKKRSPEFVEMLRERATGKKPSAQSLEKRRQAMLKREFSPEHRRKIREAIAEAYVSGRMKPSQAKRSEYLDRCGRVWVFRSSWERDVARQLDEYEVQWAYEPHKLLLSDGRIYIPDFWLEALGFYIEVKGAKVVNGEIKVRYPKNAAKVRLAITDGHPIELLFSNDIFISPPLVARLGIATKRENHTLELVAS